MVTALIATTGDRPYRADDPRLWDDSPRACERRRNEAIRADRDHRRRRKEAADADPINPA